MTLRVYLHNKFCGNLFTTENRGIVFRYDESYLCSQNAQALSISLPLRKDEFSQKECLPYFSGLLPEGEVKRQISSYLHISESSTVKLLKALGGECAGTVVFNSEDEPPLQLKKEYELNDENYTLITDKGISNLIDKMEESPLVLSRKDFRLSLAGAQQKIALAYFDDKWFVPKGNAPSTHIIKPSRRDFSDIAQNEYLSMQLGGIFIGDVASSSLIDFCGKKVFCVRRFDRRQDGNKIRRVHQEDMCQVRGIMGDKKYQSDGGPSIKDIYKLISEQSSNPITDMRKLLRSVIFQFLIGNCDAHGKNFSFLEENGSIFLSPSYDIVSTAIYPSLTRKLSMTIGNEYALDKIGHSHLIELADKIGMKISTINTILEDFEKKIPDAIEFLKKDKVAFENRELASAIWEGFLARWDSIHK
ncbi:MAG: type II toxin-antitoxin system HipA family toxin [Treponema sp.]|nr:type II toxin-antitoxin system HipA family toxin [Treponema sp.]MBD5403684.1 type II toxin-antitoxin system HipA family toxin [Treponema sp.]